MGLVNKIEKLITGWLKPIPSLPKNAQKWIAENVWWITVISLIASVIGLFVILFAVIAFATFIPTNFYGAYVTTAYVGPSIAALIVSLAFYVVTVALTAMAIKPLMKKEMKGWNLLFLILVASSLLAVINFIVSFNIFGLISNVVGLAVGAYFLIQIKSYFGSTLKARHIQKAATK